MTDSAPIRPEELLQMAAHLQATHPKSRVARIYRACAKRIAELEDAIDKSDAGRDLAISCGRDAHAAAVLKEIEKRRGKDWNGGKTLRQTTAVTRDRLGQPYCDACRWFHPEGAHDPVCGDCGCAHEYHDGPSGQCTNGAHSWSCNCTGYQIEPGRGRQGSRKRRGKTVTAKTRRKAVVWYYVGMPLRHRIDGKAVPMGPMRTLCGLSVNTAIISTNADHCGRCARAHAAEVT